VDSSVVGYDGGRNVRDEERRLNSKSGWKPWKPALRSKSESEEASGPRRLTKRQVLWAIGMVVALLTTALLIVNLRPEIWKGLLEERNLTLIAIGVSVTAIIVLLAIGGAASSWTGFRGKTVWDLLQLLIVPLALAVIGLWFASQQDARQQQIETQRAEAERKLAVQRAQDEALQTYLDQMSQLMLDRKLLEAGQGTPLYTLAQARTSTLILRLDAEHNESVTRFLINSGLAKSSEASARLLREITLSHATLSNAYLPDADLFVADLSSADLSGAVLDGANLRGADLSGADLRHADLYKADLSDAILGGADLSGANLRGADLRHAYLLGADLRDANLRRADLNRAFGWTEEQLRAASSLEVATMPNGQKYHDWLKSKENGKNE
jgi:uncharacterized protein YjbI with pentapeptide repeats